MKKEEKKPQYVICPRCELNYINKKDKYCTVCKAEMGLLDASILIPDDEEIGIEKLCPICHVNYIGEDEEICFLCAKERDDKNIASDTEDEWKEFPLTAEDDIHDDEIVAPIGGDEPFEDEEEETDEFADAYAEPDDFDFDVDPDDYDEDEDEEEEEDDDL